MSSSDNFGPAAIRVDLGAIFVSLELSRKTWLLTSVCPGEREKVSRKSLAAGDVAGLLALLEQLKDRVRERTGRDYRIVCIQEAGLDGFWLHRVLESHGVESWVVDPASIAVNRRQRRAKTDNIDGEKLLDALMGFLRGDRDACKMVRPPSVEDEDRRRPCRERQVLLRERIGHTNRIKGLLFSQGISDYDPILKNRRTQLEGLTTGDGRPLPEHMKRQILREIDRLERVMEQLRQVEADRDALLQPAPAAEPRPRPGANLTQLKGIAEERAATLGAECLWRTFANQRQVTGYAGLGGTPFQSGKTDREQGISKAGNKHVRRTMIELAWSWLQYQPQSELSLWFQRRLGQAPDRRRKKVLIAALARKLLIALWRFDTQGVVPPGAAFKTA